MVAPGCCSESGGVWVGYAWTLVCNLSYFGKSKRGIRNVWTLCFAIHILRWIQTLYPAKMHTYPPCTWGCLHRSCPLGFYEKVEPLVHETQNTYDGTCDEARLQRVFLMPVIWLPIKFLLVNIFTKTWCGVPTHGRLRVDSKSSMSGPQRIAIWFLCIPKPGLTYARICFLWLGMATWSDEDYIGRVSRTARKVHPLRVAHSTIKRCLVTYKKEWQKVTPAQRL